MKKILTIVAVMAMASVASAASFLWTSVDGNLVDSAGVRVSAVTGGDILLVYLGAGATADWSSAAAVTWGDSGHAGSFSGAKGAAKVYNTFAFNYNDGDVANGQWYGVAFAPTEGGIFQLLDHNTQTAIDASYQISGMSDNSWLGDQFNFAPIGDFEAVPEPTSMALLALGIAALGLKRKFRA